jgi:hypothetical protein
MRNRERRLINKALIKRVNADQKHSLLNIAMTFSSAAKILSCDSDKAINVHFTMCQSIALRKNSYINDRI